MYLLSTEKTSDGWTRELWNVAGPVDVKYDFHNGKIRGETWFKHGKRHRDRKKPCELKWFASGALSGLSYYRHGQLHRGNSLPAHVRFWDSGQPKRIEWWVDGRLHRDNGPALTAFDSAGTPIRSEWYKHDAEHRLEGPAVVTPRTQRWYIEGRRVPPALVAEKKKAVKQKASLKRMSRVTNLSEVLQLPRDVTLYSIGKYI